MCSYHIGRLYKNKDVNESTSLVLTVVMHTCAPEFAKQMF